MSYVLKFLMLFMSAKETLGVVDGDDTSLSPLGLPVGVLEAAFDGL
jgi:hypothetical protein